MSKLAGFNLYYKKDFRKTIALAESIINNGKEECEENQYYYYAALAALNLGLADSAKYYISQAPAPNDTVETMLFNDVMAQISLNEQDYKSFGIIESKNKQLSTDFIDGLKEADLIKAESEYHRAQAERQAKTESHNKLLLAIILLIVLAVMTLLAKIILNRRAIAYQRDLDMARAEIEKTICEYEDRISEIESSLDKQRLLLDEKDKTIKKVAKENDKLISRQTEINRQISRIVRKRLAAINEIYSDIRLRTADNTAYKQSVPLISLIKGWNEKKQLYMITPKESFWKDLHQSIDDEYHGLASFVKNKYSLTVREFQLFLLLSAKISPQIIKLFMDFSNPTTVSNYKKKKKKNLTGHEMKLEDFIQDYLDGKLN